MISILPVSGYRTRHLVLVTAWAWLSMSSLFGMGLSTAAQAAGVDSPPRLCQHNIGGEPEFFACVEVHDAGNRYLLLYHGSPFPSVEVLHRSGIETRPVSQQGAAVRYRANELPAGVPRDADYQTTSVCQVTTNRLVPCAVYELTLERFPPSRLRYVVYYDPDGRGPIQTVVKEVAGMIDHNPGPEWVVFSHINAPEYAESTR